MTDDQNERVRPGRTVYLPGRSQTRASPGSGHVRPVVQARNGSGQAADPKQTPAAAGPPTVCARWKAQPRRSGPSGIRKPRSLQRTEGTIKPSPIRPAVESGFTIDDFAYDDQTGTLTCPNGVTRPLSAQRRVTFGAACQGCPLRDRCTNADTARTITVHRHEMLQRCHRQRAQDPDLQQTYRAKRSLAERSIAWLVRGNRRVPTAA